MKLEELVAVITGGGSGIGKAVAQLFAAEGAKVCIADVNVEAANRTQREIVSNGGVARALGVDVSKFEEVSRLAEFCQEIYGPPHAWVNAAGMLITGNAIDTPESDWRRILEVNLTGTFLCCKAVLPSMIANRRGSIINFSSSTGSYLATSNAVAYVASKGGVALLTKAMAADHADSNVRINAICPGPTNTPMLSDDLPTDQLVSLSAAVPMKRLCEPEEIARVALFLASDDSSFITGSMIPVDGGQTAKI